MVNRNAALFAIVAAVMSCTAIPPAEGTQAPLKAAAVKPVIAKPAAIVTAAMPTAMPASGSDFWLSRDPVQGGLVLGRAPAGAVKISLNGNPVRMASDGSFLMGFDRDADNSASLVATLGNGKSVDRYLKVYPTQWQIEHINTRQTGGAATTAEFDARRGPELAQINAARAVAIESNGWRQSFIWPVKGRVSGLFGAQRIYRGTAGSYHSGMDIAGPIVNGQKRSLEGVAFVAPADGVVVLAAQDAFTLEGHLLIINHGMGLTSAFLHCSQLLVKVGDIVRQGQVIGRVGSTGRATGPHLHWGMKWNAAKVDPKLLLPTA